MTIPCIRNSALLIRSCVRTHKRQLGDFFNTNSPFRNLTNQTARANFRRQRFGGRYDANELFNLYPQMDADYNGSPK